MNTPTDGIAPVALDYLNLDSLFAAEELELRDRVRAFVDARIRPNINAWYEAARFPRELARELGELGVLGMHLDGYGCPGAAQWSMAWRCWSSRRATRVCVRSRVSRGR